MFEVQADIADVELVDGPEPLLPKARFYANLEKTAPRMLSKQLDQPSLNRVPVGKLVAGQRMVTVKKDVVTLTVHQLSRSWSERYGWHAGRTAKSPTFPATISGGQCRAVSGGHRKPGVAKVRRSRSNNIHAGTLLTARNGVASSLFAPSVVSAAK